MRARAPQAPAPAAAAWRERYDERTAMSQRSILFRPAGMVVLLVGRARARAGGGAERRRRARRLRRRRRARRAPSKSPGGPVVLTVVGAKGSKSFSLAELEALPAYTGYAGIKDSVGVVTAPVQYTGVPLATLTAQVGGVDSVLRRDRARQGRLRHDVLGRPGGRRRLCDLRPGHRRRAPAGPEAHRADRLRETGQAARPERGGAPAPGVRRAHGRHRGRRPLVGALGRQGRGQEVARRSGASPSRGRRARP